MEDKRIERDKKKLGLVISGIGLIIGAALLIFGSVGDFGSTKSSVKSEESATPVLDAKNYEEEVENKIKELCYGVRGVGKVSVMVSLRGGYKTVYAMDAQSTPSGYRSEIVKVGSGSNQEGIITGYENPQIIGVGIVCEGGDDSRVKNEIVSLVSAALDISTNKIFVASGV